MFSFPAHPTVLAAGYYITQGACYPMAPFAISAPSSVSGFVDQSAALAISLTDQRPPASQTTLTVTLSSTATAPLSFTAASATAGVVYSPAFSSSASYQLVTLSGTLSAVNAALSSLSISFGDPVAGVAQQFTVTAQDTSASPAPTAASAVVPLAVTCAASAAPSAQSATIQNSGSSTSIVSACHFVVVILQARVS